MTTKLRNKNRTIPSRKLTEHNPIFINGIECERRCDDEITRFILNGIYKERTVYGMIYAFDWLKKEQNRINNKPGRKAVIVKDKKGYRALMYL